MMRRRRRAPNPPARAALRRMQPFRLSTNRKEMTTTRSRKAVQAIHNTPSGRTVTMQKTTLTNGSQQHTGSTMRAAWQRRDAMPPSSQQRTATTSQHRCRRASPRSHHRALSMSHRALPGRASSRRGH